MYWEIYNHFMRVSLVIIEKKHLAFSVIFKSYSNKRFLLF